MIDLLVPTARIVDVAVVYEDQIPWDMQGQLSGTLRGQQQVQDFAHAVGRNRMPQKPLLLYGADDSTPILIVGEGCTEAAEMEDLALNALDKQAENVRKYGRGMNFAEMRERRGQPPAERFDRDFRDACLKAVQYMKRHSRTDPRARYMNEE